MIDFSFLAQNQMLQALIGGTLTGGVLYQLRSIPGRLYNFLEFAFTSQMTVISTDPSYNWIEAWANSLPRAQKSRFLKFKSIDSDDRFTDMSFAIVPHKMTFWTIYKKKPMRISFTEKDKPAGTTGGISSMMEPTLQINIQTVGRSTALLHEIANEAHRMSMNKPTAQVYIYRGWWYRMTGKEKRKLETVILRYGQLDEIVNDIDRFLNSRDWYLERGIPYRRGYLFKGPPGTGKTSLVFTLACHFNRPVCLLNIASIRDDNDLISALMDTPHNAIVLLEDIDRAGSVTQDNSAPALVGTESESSDEDRKGITQAGLLNALDGVATPEGRLFMLTTNHPEKLDKALIRPGRCDRHFDIGYHGPVEQQRMAERFYGDGIEFDVIDQEIAPVKLQAAFQEYPSDPKKAFDILKNGV